MNIKAALCQTEILWEDKPQNIGKAENFIKAAAGQNAEIVLFPEMSFTGFSMDIEKTKEFHMETADRVKEFAARYGVLIGFGWVKAAENKAENHYTVISKDGEILSDYVKIHSFQYGGEGEQFVSGSSVCSFHYRGVCFTPFICYDLRFPEIFRMAMDETDVYLIPANWPSSRSMHWNTLLKARAIENQAYVLGINCVGEIGGLSYHGDTSAIDPNGNLIGYLSGKEGILYIPIDTRDLGIRKSFPVRADRKPSVYGKL